MDKDVAQINEENSTASKDGGKPKPVNEKEAIKKRESDQKNITSSQLASDAVAGCFSTLENDDETVQANEDKAIRPTASSSAGPEVNKKSRGKPQAKKNHVSNSRTIRTTPKAQLGVSTKRRATKSYTTKNNNSLKKLNKFDRKKVTPWRSDLNLKKRLKNVKSKLFSETKSFSAYKRARSKESEERRKRLEKMTKAKRAEQSYYADRSIDFSKRSKRQRLDAERRLQTGLKSRSFPKST